VKPIKLKTIADELDAQFEDYRMYYNKSTGEIITVSREELGIAEDSEEGADFLEYDEEQRENIVQALDIIMNDENYVELPDKDDIYEYDIMEEFAEDNDELSRAMRGRGAFRRFKDEIIEQGIEDDWYDFKEKALIEIAREWCKGNGIAYEE
jgi:hypothetical protein